MSDKTKSKNDSRDLTQGPVWLKLYNLSMPMVFGIVAVMSISIVDTYFVGKLGTKPLAALSFTFPVTMTISSIAIGISAGAASIVSRAMGAKDMLKVCRASTDSLILSSLIVLIICAIGYFTINPLFSILGAKGETLDMVGRYMRIWYLSMPFLVIPMVVNGLIRSTGDSLWPSLIMIGSAVINIGLTPMFIFGYGIFPALDIEGAAIATAIAYFITFIFSLYILIVREKMVLFEIPSFNDTVKSWKEVLKIALPAGFGNAVNPFCVGIVTGFVATYGDATVAAFGAATRIEALFSIVMFALSAAIGPVAGQNWGAGKKDRAIKAQKISFIADLIWSTLIAIIFFFTAKYIAPLFSDDKQVQEIIILYLMIVPITLWGYGITIAAAGCYNAIDKPILGLIFYLIRSAIFYVPLSWAAIQFFDEPQAVFIAIALANVASGIIIAFTAIHKMKKL